MSDIPMGSPPVPPGRHAAPGGWYPDPVDARQERYWDGWQWSRNTRSQEGAAPPPSSSWSTPPGTGLSGQPYPPYGAGPPTGAYGGGPAYPPTVARPALLTPDGVPVASWWWRALAAVLDSLFVGVLSLLLSLPLYRKLFAGISAYYAQVLQAARAGAGSPPAMPDFSTLVTTSDQVLIALVGLGVGMTYQVGFLRRRSATPGKIVCGLRVVPVDQGRYPGRLSWSAVVLRAAIWVVPGVYSGLFLITIADVLVPLGQPKRQALHDLAARTQVVRRPG